jgi:hypothetical protein
MKSFPDLFNRNKINIFDFQVVLHRDPLKPIASRERVESQQ